MNTRTTRIGYTTANGTVVGAHQTTGLHEHAPWLPTASAFARIDRPFAETAPSRGALIGVVEANIFRSGRQWSIHWGGKNMSSRVEYHRTLDACLRRMGEVAVATLAIEPRVLDWGPGPYGCL
jgi:hypothetical protein